MRAIDADVLIKAAEYEAEGMSEPFKSSFAVYVEWLVDKQPVVQLDPDTISIVMEMPNNCKSCPLLAHDWEYGRFYCSVSTRVDNYEIKNPEDGRDPHCCPLRS